MTQQLFGYALFFGWVFLSLAVSNTSAFSQFPTVLLSQAKACSVKTTPTDGGVALAAKRTATDKKSSPKRKKKPSMAEKRKRRQKKSIGGPNPYADLPSPKLDFSRDETAEEPIRVANPEAAAEKAKELLKAQRDSVNMLTTVRERILDRLSDAGVRKTLETNGFVVVDGFFGGDDEEATESILTQLQEEGRRMLDDGDMEVDIANLGKGQFTVPIAGGKKQYTMCPRMVEIVVSATKQVPEVFGKSDADDQESDKPSVLDLEASACMATLRTFDRKALKASLALLRGNDDDESALDISAEETPLTVVADKEDDKRRLSLHYYIVPDTWHEQCGGGLEFEGGAKVNAKQDRLVVFYSDTTKCKAIPWKGSDDSSQLTIGNSIELDLIEKRQ